MFIQIKNVVKEYIEGKQALKGVTLDINKGEILGLLGVNGSGKTTLSSILATLIPPTQGDILYNGASIYNNINDYRRIIGFCPQRPNLNNQLTVRDNLYLDALYYGFSTQEASQKLDEIVTKLSLQEYLNAKPMMLSGGYKQRVMIGRALMHDPQFVLLDEPTVGLDPHIRKNLWNLILDLQKENITVLLTTHYLDEAEYLSNRVCVLDRGHILLIDTPQNLKTKHKTANLEDAFIKLMEEETR